MKVEPLKIGNLTAAIPVIQGGMGVGISLSGLAGAVAGCGGIGIISTAQIGYRDPEFDKDPIGCNLRAIGEEIKKAKEISKGGIVGVNIMVATRRYEDYVRAAAKAGADIIISGAGLPMTLPDLVKDYPEAKIAPIVSSVKSAQVICRYWWKKYHRLPDLVVIEGPLAGGHLGFTKEQLMDVDSLDYDNEITGVIETVKTFAAEAGVEIPVVVAGGIYDREDMLHQLELGANGVQVATRFITTYECDAHEEFKRCILEAGEEDIQIVQSPVGMPGRAIMNPFMQKAKEARIPHGLCHLCVSTCKPQETPYCITDALVNAARGNVEEALIFCGAKAYKSKKMEYVTDVMKEFQI